MALEIIISYRIGIVHRMPSFTFTLLQTNITRSRTDKTFLCGVKSKSRTDFVQSLRIDIACKRIAIKIKDMILKHFNKNKETI